MWQELRPEARKRRFFAVPPLVVLLARGQRVARHLRELRAWQLCHGVRVQLVPILRRPTWLRDTDLRSQLRRAIRSACNNVAEGFYRFHHREFAHFVKIARASLGEVQDHLTEARAADLLTLEEARTLTRLVDDALGATTRLMKYLQQSPDVPAASLRRRPADRREGGT